MLKPCSDSPDVVPDLRVGFLLAPRFSLLPFAGFVDSLRHAADDGDRSRQIYCTWSTVGLSLKPVTASCGFQVWPERTFPPPETFDYLVVVGGLLPWCLDLDDEAYGYIRDSYAANVTLIGLCTGSFIIGEAGLIDDHRCAVHDEHRAEFGVRFPRATADCHELFVNDRNIITCPGGVSALDLAFALIEAHCGKARSAKGERSLLASKRDATDCLVRDPHHQLSTCGDERVERAIRYMQSEIARPCGVAALARKLDCSERELNRAFAYFTEAGPTAVWRDIRLAHSQQLLLNTRQTVTRIAYDCGFSDTAHFSRWFKRAYGEPPTLYRNRRRQLRAGGTETPGAETVQKLAHKI